MNGEREGGREGETDRERVWEAGPPGRDGGSAYMYILYT